MTALFVDEFGGGRLDERAASPDLGIAPEQGVPAGDEEDLVALEHDSEFDEEPPPLEPAHEEDEPYESGLESSATAGGQPD